MLNSVQDKMLNAAAMVIMEGGITNFTLEQVAKKAEVSKGGLLYYFPNKDALIKGLVDNYINNFGNSLRAKAQQIDNPTEYDWLKLYTTETFELPQDPLEPNLMYGLIAAVALNHDLLLPLKQDTLELNDIISKLKDPVIGTIIQLVCEGLAYDELFEIRTFNADLRQKVFDRLIQLLDTHCK